jgi:hypothetical protein
MWQEKCPYYGSANGTCKLDQRSWQKIVIFGMEDTINPFPQSTQSKGCRHPVFFSQSVLFFDEGFKLRNTEGISVKHKNSCLIFSASSNIRNHHI